MQLFPESHFRPTDHITESGPAAASTGLPVPARAESADDRSGGTPFEAVLASVIQEAQAGGTVLSSFIEEGRTDYSGLPSGFSAYVSERGTVDRDEAAYLKKALRERGVSELSIEALDRLTASGAPVTVSRIFSVLSGNARISEPLAGEDRMHFMQFTARIGFSKTESENLLGLSDDGKTAAAWKQIAAKIKELDGSVDVSKNELSALLKGLDLPAGVSKNIMNRLAGQDDATLDKHQLNTLLSEAATSIAAKTSAQETAQKHMRDAVDQALKEADLRGRSGPVSDMRGSRASTNQERLMRDAVREQSGGELLNADRGEEPAGTASGAHNRGADRAGDGRRIAEDTATGKAADTTADKATDRRIAEAAYEHSPAQTARKDALDGSRRAGTKDAPDAPDASDASDVAELRPGKGRVERVLGNGGGNEGGNGRGNAGDAGSGAFGDASGDISGGQANARAQANPAAESARQAFIHTVESAYIPTGTTTFTNQAPSAQVLNNTNRVWQQEIFSQVEKGILSHTQDGGHRLTLQLNPEELGRVTLMLSVNQGEVKAVIRAEQPESAALLQEKIAELKTSLEEQGLKVAELEVRSGLNEHDAAGAWDGAREHNRMQDAQERARMVRLAKLRQDASFQPSETGEPDAVQARIAAGGQNSLHIVA